MHVLVLGSSGVIGTGVARYFEQRGDVVIPWDVTISSGHDLSQQNALDDLLGTRHVDLAIFLAFDVGGSKYPVNSTEYISRNVRLMEFTFASLSKYKIPFIHATSQMSNMDHNPYGVLKRLGEFYTQDLKGINVKIWNVYGPEQVGPKSHVIADFIHQARNNSEIRMITNGQETRQFLHVDDFSRAIGVLADNFENFKGKTVDVSNFEWVSISDVAHLISSLCGPNIPVICGEAEASFQTKTNQPNMDFLETGWRPMIGLREGISRLVESSSVKTDYMDVIMNTVMKGKGDSDKHLLTMLGIALSCKSKNILELGVRSGGTTLPLLLAAKLNGGTLTSVDISLTQFTAPPDLAQFWNFVQSDALEFLRSKSSPPYDLVYIDDWHAYRHVKTEMDLLDSMVSPNTVILLHDLMYGNHEPRYHCDLTMKDGQWAEGGPYRAVAELNPQFWEFSTIPSNNGLTILRKKYSSKYLS